MASAAEDIQESQQHPHADKWRQPEAGRPELVVYNTLTRTKVSTPMLPGMMRRA